MEAEKSLTELKSNLPTLPDGRGIGFDCMEQTDFVSSKISIVQPSSQTNVTAGEWYDINSDQSIGKEIKFFVFSKRTIHFTTKDNKTGEEKQVEKKEILVMPESLDFPFIISLSVTGYWPFSNIMTKLYKGYGIKGYPIFSGLIKATTELVMNEKGKYYIPKFEFERHATSDEMKKLLIAYEQTAKAFNSTEKEEITDAEFNEPEKKSDEIMEALGLEQKDTIVPPKKDQIDFKDITI